MSEQRLSSLPATYSAPRPLGPSAPHRLRPTFPLRPFYGPSTAPKHCKTISELRAAGVCNLQPSQLLPLQLLSSSAPRLLSSPAPLGPQPFSPSAPHPSKSSPPPPAASKRSTMVASLTTKPLLPLKKPLRPPQPPELWQRL